MNGLISEKLNCPSPFPSAFSSMRPGWMRGVATLLLLGAVMGHAQTGATPRVRAPEFRSPDAWLNTDEPLTMEELRGQVVLLDFWTYCCINCMHVLPDLKYLEDKYANQPFVVVGVHSGKFSQEKDPANIRQAILRHNIAHPVVVDSDYQIWESYAVRCWPTLILIDPQGYVVRLFEGEGHRAALDQAIAEMLAEHKRKGTLARPLAFRRERADSPGVLSFPGKVLADAKGGRLFISDTNNHRVLLADFDGQVRAVIGLGEIGLQDGAFADARFHQPQGLALSADGSTLYVADTENHALRAVDLKAKRVATIAGTGEQARGTVPSGFGPKTDLSSPWDLARVDDELFIAMAGSHQIWVYEIDRRRVRLFAGSGREAGIDGVNRSAAFAQPSGLATDGKTLYVADAEISSIRAVETRRAGRTTTLAGSGGLFDFGAADGVGDAARFQHPLGVALWNGKLFVADTFNHTIRLIDLDTREVTTWLGTGKPGLGMDDKPGLFEPGGLSIAGDTLYITDTNHHRILAVGIPTKAARVVDVRLLVGHSDDQRNTRYSDD